MDLLTLIIVLGLIGVVLYLVLQLPMPQLYRNAVIVIVVLLIILWLVRVLVGPLPRVVVP